MAHLQPNDLKILKHALSAIPQFAIAEQRRTFIRDTLGDFPGIDKALPYLDWQGGALVVADNLIQFLGGHEAAGVPALRLIAQAIQPMCGASHRDEIVALRRRMGWTPDIVFSPAKEWGDHRSADVVTRELIIGENTLRPMYYLRRALRAGDAVVRVDMDGVAIGTGFMVAPGLMMTNNHVIANEEEAQRSQVLFFNEVQDPTPGNQDPLRSQVTAHPAKKALLYTNPQNQLDFSFIRLVDCPQPSSYLHVRPAVAEQNQRVVIIQHPGGFPKQISMQNNLVAMANGQVVQYYTSTQAGSSGSPVLDNGFAVIAIHHSWVHNEEWTGDELRITDPKQILDREFRNQGTSMAAVVNDLQMKAPDLLKELSIVD